MNIDAGARTPAGKAECEQIRLLIEGDISYGDKEYQAVSCMYLPANVPYASTSSKKGRDLICRASRLPGGRATAVLSGLAT